MVVPIFYVVSLLYISTVQCVTTPVPEEEPLILTPYLERGQISKGRQLSKVTSSVLSENVLSYSGFFTVDKAHNSNLFFWFFPPKVGTPPWDTPLILWLNGGPGSSSQFGLFVENGPFFVNETSIVSMRETSWTKRNALLYIDSPVGTGFSFTDNEEEGYATSMIQVTDALYSTLCQFFQLFPEYRQSRFFLTGESFAGQYIPHLALKILQQDDHTCQNRMHVDGIAIGNGFIDPENSLDYATFLYNLGLLDERGRRHTELRQAHILQLIKRKQWTRAFQEYDKFIGYSGRESYFLSEITGIPFYYNILVSQRPPDYDNYKKFVEQEEIRRGVHVGPTKHFQSGRIVMDKLQHEIMKSAKALVYKLITADKSIPFLLYSGQLDLIVASRLTDDFLDTLNLTQFQRAPKQIWRPLGQVAGYFKTYRNFTRLTVRNAGHILPYDQPLWGYQLINSFIHGGFTDTGREYQPMKGYANKGIIKDKE